MPTKVGLREDQRAWLRKQAQKRKVGVSEMVRAILDDWSGC